MYTCTILQSKSIGLPVDNILGLCGRRILGITICHQLDADKQAPSSDVTDQLMSGLQVLKFFDQVSSNCDSIFAQLFVVNNVENR